MKGDNKKAKDHKIDHLAPTQINEQKPISAPAQIKGLSHKEIEDKLEVYSKVGDKMDRFFTFQKSKEKFKADRQKANDNRIKQDVHYSDGERRGLQQSRHDVIKDDRDWKDQNDRDELMKKSKEEYDKDGLKKNFKLKHKELGKRHAFNHAHNQYRSKDKGMEKDK